MIEGKNDIIDLDTEGTVWPAFISTATTKGNGNWEVCEFPCDDYT